MTVNTKGREAPLGATRVAKNGYHYTKVLDAKKKPYWRLTHHIIAETSILKRPLAADERVAFIGSQRDLSLTNIVVKKKALPALDRRINMLKDKIGDLQDELDNLLEQKRREQKNV